MVYCHAKKNTFKLKVLIILILIKVAYAHRSSIKGISMRTQCITLSR